MSVEKNNATSKLLRQNVNGGSMECVKVLFSRIRRTGIDVSAISKPEAMTAAANRATAK